MGFKARILIYCFVCLLFSKIGLAQTDTEFWFAAPAITAGHENKPIVLRITGYDKPALITITQPANPSFEPIQLNTAAFTTITYDLTYLISTIESRPSATVLNTGLKISSTANISVYYEVGQQRNPEIFPLKGMSAKGLSFIVPSQMLYNNQVNLNPPANNGFVIVATEDNTVVDINLTQADANGHPIGNFSITLQKGQSYAVVGSGTQAALHLGGTAIKANKPICVTIFDDSIFVGTSWDLAGDQIVPIVNTGTEYIVVRGALNAPNYTNTDMYYVWATEDGTAIYINGSTTPVATINKGNYYMGLLTDNSVYVTTSHPAYVLQFTGTGTEVAETVLPSIKCTGSNEVSFVRSTTENFYLNIICKEADIGFFSLNGNPNIIGSNLFEAVPGTIDWMAARISVNNLANLNSIVLTNQSTTISNSNGLFHLGFLNGGNVSGSRLGYFSNYSKVAMAPNLTTSSCLGGDIQLEAKKLNNVQYVWSGPNQFSSTIYNPIIHNAGLKDSGYYYVQATIPGCGTSIDSVRITIHALPTISLAKSLDTVCKGSIKNIDFALTGKAPWNLVFTDGIKNDTVRSIQQSVTHFSVNPVQNTIYQIISIADSNACDINRQINPIYDTIIVNQLPIAQFDHSVIHCEKSPITFTDRSTVQLDQIVQWHWNFGNQDTITMQSNASVDRTFMNAGVDTIQLVVVSSMGCISDTLKKVIDIFHLPQLGFILPNVCLDGGMAVFKDTSAYPYFPTNFRYQWNFNASTSPIQPAPTVSSNQYTAKNPSVLYNIGGDYQVSLKVTTTEGCADSLTKTFTINGSNPIATFRILKDTALCSNQAVQIKDSSWVYPGKVGVLQINWGDGKDTIINNATVQQTYQHLYPINPISPQLNYTIQLKAYSGGTCLDSVAHAIQILPPPQSVQLNALHDFVCINDSLKLNATILGGVAPFEKLYTINNNNALVIGDQVFGKQEGNINVSMQITDAKRCVYTYPDLLLLNLPQLPIATMQSSDTVICNTDAVLLKGTGANTFKWYKDASLFKEAHVDSIYVQTPGNYSLIVNDGKCNSMPAAIIKLIAYDVTRFTFSNSSLTCTNGALVINTNAQAKDKMHFLWDFGDSTSSNTPIPADHQYTRVGHYLIRLKVTNDYCPKYNYTLLSDSVQVVAPLPASAFTLFVLPEIDTLLMPLKIDSGYTRYTWSPTYQLSNPLRMRPIFNGSESIKYLLLREDPNSGCKINDTYMINVSSDVVVNIPKAFTPNHDNLNDYLKIEHGAGVKQLNYFSIYNRWGKMVFSTNNLSQGWDGKFENEPQLMDQYSYIIDFVTYKEEHVRKTGSFILIR